MWDDAFPSFLIGLREGLEAGLIVSILVATLVRAGARNRLAQVWTGVLAAIALAMSFGAVLTFTAASLSATAQEAFGGTLSVIAVAFVTAMVFWMRRSARSLSGEIKEKVTGALAMGSGVLIVTSFLAVGREGLETALFLWTTARAAGESAGPLTGAGIGLVLAAGLCWGLYRRVLKINLTKFFTYTGAVLIVIAAGVLGYGLRDLQEGRVFPGNTAYALDLSGSIDAGSWYSTLLQGVLNITPTMTWLQTAGYVGYLAVVMTLFVRGVRASAPKPAAEPNAPQSAAEKSEVPEDPAADRPESKTAVDGPEPTSGAEEPEPEPASSAEKPQSQSEPEPEPQSAAGEPEPRPAAPVPAPAADRPEPQPARGPRRRPAWVVPVAVVAVPVVVAGVVVAVARPKPSSGQTVAVSETECGKGFTAPKAGRQTFQMQNTGSKTSEVYLIDPGTNAVYGEIEGLAPGTTRDLVATVAGGTYAWRCVPSSGKAVTSKSVTVTGGGSSAKAVVPVSENDLAAPLKAYKEYVDQGLATLVAQTRTLDADIEGNHLDQARTDWLTAHLAYSSLGAAYGTFEDFDKKINGRADGLAGGVADPDFAGFHRIEYGLWHGQSADELKTPAQALVDAAAGLQKAFPTQDFDPGDLPLRAHEILENTLQFELTADTDLGSGTNLATANANLAGTNELLTVLRPLLTARAPKLLPTVDADIARLQKLLDAEHQGVVWTSVETLDAATRQQLNGATGQLLEDLAPVPDLLEIRKSA
ncbi:high-affinity iron transporter [Streptomyces sp. Ag109_O5-1]|uniref:iron uptake transporter permease EfeU n=1 Tax=Streptomyces sp. Ag109_O5-1 TaxID=1938851 RepID=UPI000F501BB7|nr:iron uptake transporter permease EfeU [Streptomyces sp. Ag109_O5-1]RPE46396.1 high-affinity iron transporter [Streptomyces sp. Ag109_O5-1]